MREFRYAISQPSIFTCGVSHTGALGEGWPTPHPHPTTTPTPSSSSIPRQLSSSLRASSSSLLTSATLSSVAGSASTSALREVASAARLRTVSSLAGKDVLSAASTSDHVVMLTSRGAVIALSSRALHSPEPHVLLPPPPEGGKDLTAPDQNESDSAGPDLHGPRPVRLCASPHGTFVVLSSGVVLAQGNNETGALGLSHLAGDDAVVDSLVQVDIKARIVDVAAGESHSLFVTHTGAVYAVGSNPAGQLGLGSKAFRKRIATPILVPSVSHIAAAAVGNRHSVLVNTDGVLFVAGSNASGQLGLPSTPRPFHTFHELIVPDAPGGIVSVAAGSHFSLFLSAEGVVFGAGDLSSAVLDPQKVPTGPGVHVLIDIASAAPRVSHISVADSLAVYTTSSGDVFASGRYGNGSSPLPLAPAEEACAGHDGSIVSVSLAHKVSVIQRNAKPKHSPQSPRFVRGNQIAGMAAGDDFSVFLAVDGTVFVCGHNGHGQLGIGLSPGLHQHAFHPTRVESLSDVHITAVAAGRYHTLFLSAEGKVYACGSNDYGQLGLGQDSEGRLTSVPTLIPDLDSVVVKDIAAGAHFSVFLTTTGSVYVCGQNDGGQLGLGPVTGPWVPTPIRDLSSVIVVDISAGDEHLLLLSDTGIVYASGSNKTGQLGLGPKVKRANGPKVIKSLSSDTIGGIVAGPKASFFITDKGALFVSGDNSARQLPLLPLSSAPPVVFQPRFVSAFADPGMKAFAVSASANTTAIATTNGRLYTFGSGRDGLLARVPKRLRPAPINSPSSTAAVLFEPGLDDFLVRGPVLSRRVYGLRHGTNHLLVLTNSLELSPIPIENSDGGSPSSSSGVAQPTSACVFNVPPDLKDSVESAAGKDQVEFTWLSEQKGYLSGVVTFQSRSRASAFVDMPIEQDNPWETVPIPWSMATYLVRPCLLCDSRSSPVWFPWAAPEVAAKLPFDPKPLLESHAVAFAEPQLLCEACAVNTAHAVGFTSLETAVKAAVATVEKVTERCIQNGTLFTDAVLPPAERMLWDSRGGAIAGHSSRSMGVPLRFGRIGSVAEGASAPQIQGGVSGRAMEVGAVDTAYLLGVLGACSRRPGVVDSLFVAHNVDIGIYTVRISWSGKWFFVIIDDWIPMMEARAQVLYGGSGGGDSNLIAVSLLEKAYAKFYGSYEAIDGGIPSVALSDLTGGYVDHMILDGSQSQVWRAVLTGSMWDGMRQALEEGQIVTAYLDEGAYPPGVHPPFGLEPGVVYVVVDALVVGRERLLKLWSPQGRGEWLGDWARVVSDITGTAGEVHEFCMAFRDFAACFSVVDITAVGELHSAVLASMHHVASIRRLDATRLNVFSLDVARSGTRVRLEMVQGVQTMDDSHLARLNPTKSPAPKVWRRRGGRSKDQLLSIMLLVVEWKMGVDYQPGAPSLGIPDSISGDLRTARVVARADPSRERTLALEVFLRPQPGYGYFLLPSAIAPDNDVDIPLACAIHMFSDGPASVGPAVFARQSSGTSGLDALPQPECPVVVFVNDPSWYGGSSATAMLPVVPAPALMDELALLPSVMQRAQDAGVVPGGDNLSPGRPLVHRARSPLGLRSDEEYESGDGSGGGSPSRRRTRSDPRKKKRRRRKRAGGGRSHKSRARSRVMSASRRVPPMPASAALALSMEHSEEYYSYSGSRSSEEYSQALVEREATPSASESYPMATLRPELETYIESERDALLARVAELEAAVEQEKEDKRGLVESGERERERLLDALSSRDTLIERLQEDKNQFVERLIRMGVVPDVDRRLDGRYDDAYSEHLIAIQRAALPKRGTSPLLPPLRNVVSRGSSPYGARAGVLGRVVRSPDHRGDGFVVSPTRRKVNLSATERGEAE